TPSFPSCHPLQRLPCYHNTLPLRNRRDASASASTRPATRPLPVSSRPRPPSWPPFPICRMPTLSAFLSLLFGLLSNNVIGTCPRATALKKGKFDRCAIYPSTASRIARQTAATSSLSVASEPTETRTSQRCGRPTVFTS